MTPTIFNLKPLLDDPDIVALVALSVERPTTSRMEEICQMYQFDHDWLLRGYKLGSETVGFIGVQFITRHQAKIRHIAVAPLWRCQGVGRTLIRHILEEFPISRIDAETNAESSGFYRAIGFATESVVLPNSTNELFLCTWDLNRAP